MVTGVEVAGLVLGAFPVFLQCLEGYLKIKDMRDSKPVLKRLNRQLKMEKCKFTNTCRNLFNGIVSTDEAETLASGVGWENRDFQQNLEQHMGSENAAAFIEAVDELYTLLKKLSDAVGLDGEQKVWISFGMYSIQQTDSFPRSKCCRE
jgi:hypothetical protein